MPPENLASNIRPDTIDFRDKAYRPTLKPLEPAFNFTPFTDSIQVARVKDQKETSACTGFALSALIEILLDKEKRLTSVTVTAELGRLSPYMLYYFARRYDEIPGDEDTGSTARGAMKAWCL
jgi:hypothetical protein